MLILGIETATTQIGCAIGSHEGVRAAVHSARPPAQRLPSTAPSKAPRVPMVSSDTP